MADANDTPRIALVKRDRARAQERHDEVTARIEQLEAQRDAYDAELIELAELLAREQAAAEPAPASEPPPSEG